MPSAVGYQPNLATEMGELQERITSTKRGSVTSVQAVYVPADDPYRSCPGQRPSLTSTRPPCSRGRSSSSASASRRSRSSGVNLAHPVPTHRRARSTTTSLEEREEDSAALRRTCRTSSRSSASTSSPRRTTRLPWHAPARSSGSSSQPFHVAEIFTGIPGAYVKVRRGRGAQLQGDHPENQARCDPRAGVLSQGRHRRCAGRRREDAADGVGAGYSG